MHVTCRLLWQGEARDSSDEEWDAAYAAMDPIQQFGWRNRAPETFGVGANLVRDVFVAADEVHSNAMSVMDGNAEVNVARTSVGDGAGEGGTSPGTESSVHPSDSMEHAVEGEHDQVLECLSCNIGYCRAVRPSRPNVDVNVAMALWDLKQFTKTGS